MIQAKTISEMAEMLDKAQNKSDEMNPEIEIIETGLYHVKGSKGNWYEVRAGRLPNGDLFLACQCRGNLEGKICYHLPKVFNLHSKIRQLEIENQKRENEKNPTYLPPATGKKPEKLGNIRI